MNNILRILFIGKSDEDTDFICRKISDFGYNVIPLYADSKDNAMVYLTSPGCDLLISLHKWQDITAEEVALMLSELEVIVPWIMVYSNAQRNEIIRALNAGCRVPIDINDLDRLEYVIYSLLIGAEKERRYRAKQEKLIAEKEKFELILGSIGDGVITAGTNRQIIMMNSGAERITGWTAEDAFEKPINEVFKVVNKNTREPLVNLLDLAMDSGKVTGLKRDTVLISRKGIEKFVSACISPIRFLEDTIGVVIVFRDITRIRLTEEKLVVEQKNMNLIFDAAPIGMLLIDENTVIKKVNKSMLHIIGSHEQEMINQTIGNGLGCLNSYKDKNGCGFSEACGKCELRSTLAEIGSSQENMLGIEAQYTLLEDGVEKELWLKINSVPVEIDNRKHVVLVIDDITEDKIMQKELERAMESAKAANLAKSEFLANMSHEIRTPLNGMLGMIDLTLLTGLTEEQKDNLFIARGCASTLLNLINDILDFSRIEARKLTMESIGFNLEELMEQTIKPHNIKAYEKGLELKYQLDPRIPQIVNGDPNRLKQVINNLLGNAIKFTDTGEIKITASLKNSTDEYVELEFQISDTGVGIDSNYMNNLYETFSQADNSITRKYGGSGLGLAISRQLVKIMNGDIWVESKVGEGSTFYFSVKLDAGSAESNIKHNIDAIVRAKNPLRILLAEDDRINQVVITRMIKEGGHFVETVNNGIEALRAINEKKFDVVLMDIQMPEMDGIEAVSRVRENEKGTQVHVPIIALTAYALQGDREKYLSVGMDDYIAKPVQMNNLLETIAKVVEKSKERKQNKAFVENEYFCDCDNTKQKGLLLEHNDKTKRMISSIFMNSEHLKDALENKDSPLVEKYAHEIKELSSSISATSIKSSIFRVELAARRDSIDAATEHFSHFIEELNSYKKLFEDNII